MRILTLFSSSPVFGPGPGSSSFIPSSDGYGISTECDTDTSSSSEFICECVIFFPTMERHFYLWNFLGGGRETLHGRLFQWWELYSVRLSCGNFFNDGNSSVGNVLWGGDFSLVGTFFNGGNYCGNLFNGGNYCGNLFNGGNFFNGGNSLRLEFSQLWKVFQR